MALVISRGIVGGAKRMLDAARGISRRELDQNVEAKSGDEIGRRPARSAR